MHAAQESTVVLKRLLPELAGVRNSHDNMSELS